MRRASLITLHISYEGKLCTSWVSRDTPVKVYQVEDMGR